MVNCNKGYQVCCQITEFWTWGPGTVNQLFSVLRVKQQLVLSDESLFEEEEKIQDYENLQPAIATKETVA